jgi:hypothetical protein
LFFGVVTGVVAIVLACIALVGDPVRQRRGTSLAVAGLIVGFLDVIVWIVLIGYLLSRPIAPGKLPLPWRSERAAVSTRSSLANVLPVHDFRVASVSP